jgi:hypothetical protein
MAGMDTFKTAMVELLLRHWTTPLVALANIRKRSKSFTAKPGDTCSTGFRT